METKPHVFFRVNSRNSMLVAGRGRMKTNWKEGECFVEQGYCKSGFVDFLHGFHLAESLARLCYLVGCAQGVGAW